MEDDMYNDLKIGTKVLAAFLFIAIITAGFTGYFAFSYGKTFLERESFNKLTAVREMKAGQIEDYFKQITDQIITFSEDRMIIDAMQSFENAFFDIDRAQGIRAEKMAAFDAELLDYYEKWADVGLGENADRTRDVMPDNVRKKGGCKCVFS